MKTIATVSVITALLVSSVGAWAQNQQEDYLGLPGDNLNLYAVMKLFQESQTLEEFERNLNYEDSRINNLDLNGDNKIDYISVFDNVNGNVHNIVLQVAINQREKQDVAVFTVGRDSDGNVWLQLTGDERLYGKNYIIEPFLDNVVETPNPGYVGNATTVNGRNVAPVQTTTTTVVQVRSWPVVTYIYSPSYVVWRSSWYWGYYPPYWRPWTPHYWHYYYGYHYHWHDSYYAHYRYCDYHRHNYYHNYYYRPHHTYSKVVRSNVKSGTYKVTYSRPDERARGEALYVSTYGNRRQENVGTTNTNRRATTTAPNNRSNANSSSSSDNRRNASSSATTTTNTRSTNAASSTTTNRRSDTPAQRSASQTNTQERKAASTSSSTTRSSSTRTSQPAAKSSTTSTPARSSESRTTTTTRSRSDSNSNSSKSESRSSETRSSGESSRGTRR